MGRLAKNLPLILIHHGRPQITNHVLSKNAGLIQLKIGNKQSAGAGFAQKWTRAEEIFQYSGGAFMKEPILGV